MYNLIFCFSKPVQMGISKGGNIMGVLHVTQWEIHSYKYFLAMSEVGDIQRYHCTVYVMCNDILTVVRLSG